MLASITAMSTSHGRGTSTLERVPILSRSVLLLLRGSLQLSLPRPLNETFQTSDRPHERIGAAAIIPAMLIGKKAAQRIATLVGLHQGEEVKVQQTFGRVERHIQLSQALAGLILFQDGAKATTARKEERCRVQGVVVLPCGHGGGQSQCNNVLMRRCGGSCQICGSEHKVSVWASK